MKGDFKTNDSQVLSHLSLSDAQFEETVYRWNGTGCDFPSDKTIPELFEAQVERTPGHTALVYGDIRLTYQELNERANRLGGYLRKKYSIRPDDLVALCLERSEQMLVAILAVLKSGGAYVPIDPGYPEERIKYILSDTHTRLVIANEVHGDELKEIAGAGPITTELIDSEWFDIKLAPYAEGNLPLNNNPENLAYVIYTSGTTGKPKGVMIEHRGVINLISYLIPIHTLDKHTNVGCYSNYVFDAFVYEAFPALCNGNTVFLYDDNIRTSAGELNSYIAGNDIAVSFIPPVLLPEVIKDNGSRLRTIFTGGEKFPDVRKHFFDNILINEYGLTETTVCSTLHRYNKNDNTANIGRPIANTTVYVLDAELNPLPVGETGELHIGGVGVARGYLNQRELSNERFIRNPFQTEQEKLQGSNGRLYKTGDLVRYLADGSLEYIGRNDFQVKIRGHRIEPGEIEAVLSAFPGVDQAVVTVRESASGSKYLAAYYLAGREPGRIEMLEHLRFNLPDYLIPSALVRLKQFPLTVNGKLDRGALPDPSFSEGDGFEGPVTDTEGKLCALYAEVLGLDESRVGVNDDFFAIGGESISAMKVVTRINSALGTDVRVTAIFTHKTIRRLAAHLFGNSLGAVKIAAPPVRDPELQLLSFAQERLWFIERYEGGTNAYNIPIVFGIRESTHIESLLSALTTVIGRHETLRSVIRTNGEGVAYQLVADGQIASFQVERMLLPSFESLPAAIERSVNHIFDLGEEGPVKVQLYSVHTEGRGSHYMSIVIHHIAFDGWSADIFLQELSHYYWHHEAERFGDKARLELPELPAPKIRYREYALWQRAYLTDNVLGAQLEYWRERLSGYETLKLNPDKPRPVQVSYAGSDLNFELDKDFSNTLREVAKETGVSLFSLLLSGYYLLLSAHSNQRDIVVGTPVANRHYSELSDVIGFFINTLALRERIRGEQELISFIQQVGESVIEAQLHQDLPFEKLVKELRLEQDTSRHPVFQVAFGVHRYGGEPEGPISELIEAYRGETGYKVARFDITTNIDDSAEGIKGVFNYSTGLFSEETIAGYIHTYKNILEQICELKENRGKTKRIRDIRYLDAVNYQKVVYDWNRTERAYPADSTIQELFEAQVEKSPDQVALLYQGFEMTYRELNERANKAGRLLRERYGVRPDNIVGLCLDRSEHLLIAILGVLKSGCAYLPIDPAYPEERMRYILSDAGAIVVLTSEDHAEKVKEVCRGLQLSIECVDSPLFDIKLSLYDATNPAIVGGGSNLAYVMYTSGTTGKPKGVMVEHRGVVRLVINSNYFSANSGDTFLQLSSLFFDASTFEIWGSLLNGSKLIIVGDVLGLTSNAVEFKKYLNDNKVTILWLTKTLFDTLYIAEGTVFSGIKNLLIGGEALDKHLVDRLLCQADGPQRLINGYGPTEGTTFTTTYLCNSGAHSHLSSVLIGRPIANTTVYVLNIDANPVPVGSIGELCLGGAGVSRGYLNQPGLTSARFIANPFQTDEERGKGSNSRLYRTGDMVRYLADGNLEYVGRDDTQVKIRGYRIEPGEIEARLTSYPGVDQAVVVAMERAQSTRYLTGYYVAQHELDEDELLEYLGAGLPEYMVPSVLMRLEKLPMTANGKIDRGALPGSSAAMTSDGHSRNGTEERLCGLFGIILDLDGSKLSINDDFFRLGGDSILALRLVAAIRKEFSTEVPLEIIFSKRTISRISSYISSSGGNHLFPAITKVKPGTKVPLSLSQEEMVSYIAVDRMAPTADFIVKITGPLNVPMLEQAFLKLVQRHEVLRTIIREGENNEWFQEVMSFENWSMNYLRKSEFGDEADIPAYIKGLIHKPFDLANDYSLRVTVIDHLEGEFLLIVVFSKMAVDGWTVGILQRDLMEVYNSRLKGTEESLEELPVSYADISFWQDRYLRGGVMERQLNYWKDQLKNLCPLELKTDHRRIPLTEAKAGRAFGNIANDIAIGITRFCVEHDLTKFITLLSAFNILLYKWSRQPDICVGTTVSNRRMQEMETMAGCFANHIVIRSIIDESLTFSEMALRTKDVLFTGLSNQDVRISAVERSLDAESDPTRSGICQSHFAYENYPQQKNFYLSEVRMERDMRFAAPAVGMDIVMTVANPTEHFYFLMVDYNSSIFESGSISKMIDDYIKILMWGLDGTTSMGDFLNDLE